LERRAYVQSFKTARSALDHEELVRHPVPKQAGGFLETRIAIEENDAVCRGHPVLDHEKSRRMKQ
jgi:hypothetical protein